jgi:putative endonuclease
MGGWIYILTSRRNGTLYIGVTNNLVRRVWEHREGAGSRISSITKIYALRSNDKPA